MLVHSGVRLEGLLILLNTPQGLTHCGHGLRLHSKQCILLLPLDMSS